MYLIVFLLAITAHYNHRRQYVTYLCKLGVSLRYEPCGHNQVSTRWDYGKTRGTIV